ncbi:hypothetical protein P4N68_03565 [Corynebacterium felinum]|uniref:Uncharacterized protein n=1 Tax=Corynebacterium felinum TaxID=131318 RepID=A0ABU2B5M6_9CORY|nr:hypothetical protein [Corynebacterium felinum]MDF5820161.1 hypothetical protein [Corynebacterium felinum]MDR7353913.1 hypothetical protein [Corynebacterium felinum]WJY96086.1 hypothetical protein CFELI_12530 [Corynebacterium felinum]
MRYVVLCCGVDTPDSLPVRGENIDVFQLGAIPSRAELKQLDTITRAILPEDPTPSLDDIAKQPDVAHLGAPQPAPQAQFLPTPLRVIVIGSDAALSAVVTRLMRADTLWAEVAYIPTDTTSPVARSWGLDDDAATFAFTAPAQPTPLIRDDAAIAVVGQASVTDKDNKEITAEIIVDDHVLLRHQSGKRNPVIGIFGARLVAMLDQPGIAAVILNTPREPVARGFFRRNLSHGTADPHSLATGRALQAGGENLTITIDGVSRPRPVTRVTFYRHLRDLQAVRRI